MLYTKYHYQPDFKKCFEEWTKNLNETDWNKFIVLTTPFEVKKKKWMRSLTERFLKDIQGKDATLRAVFVVEPFADGFHYHAHLLMLTKVSASVLSQVWNALVRGELGFTKSMFRRYDGYSAQCDPSVPE